MNFYELDLNYYYFYERRFPESMLHLSYNPIRFKMRDLVSTCLLVDCLLRNARKRQFHLMLGWPETMLFQYAEPFWRPLEIWATGEIARRLK